MPRRRLPYLSDEQLVGVCQRFVNAERPATIAAWLTRELKAKLDGVKVTRQQLHYLLDEARRRSFFTVHPPRDLVLEQRISDIYAIADKARIAVVPARGPSASEYVAAEAAVLVLNLMKQLGQKTRQVHIGLGAGLTTRRVAQQLTALLRAELEPPRLVLHALTSGFQGDQPSVAPLAFFGLFDSLGLDIEYVGLFAPSVVQVGQYEQLKREPGLKESFASASEIDVVVTSLASADDPHGTLNRYLANAKPSDTKRLRREGWIGDVLYRPYSLDGPLQQRSGTRAVTLLELTDLARLAHSGKYVILLSGPCGRCEKTRTRALRPLLTSKALAVWTHLITDLQTAEELTAQKENPR